MDYSSKLQVLPIKAESEYVFNDEAIMGCKLDGNSSSSHPKGKHYKIIILIFKYPSYNYCDILSIRLFFYVIQQRWFNCLSSDTWRYFIFIQISQTILLLPNSRVITFFGISLIQKSAIHFCMSTQINKFTIMFFYCQFNITQPNKLMTKGSQM